MAEGAAGTRRRNADVANLLSGGQTWGGEALLNRAKAVGRGLSDDFAAASAVALAGASARADGLAAALASATASALPGVSVEGVCSPGWAALRPDDEDPEEVAKPLGLCGDLVIEGFDLPPSAVLGPAAQKALERALGIGPCHHAPPGVGVAILGAGAHQALQRVLSSVGDGLNTTATPTAAALPWALVHMRTLAAGPDALRLRFFIAPLDDHDAAPLAARLRVEAANGGAAKLLPELASELESSGGHCWRGRVRIDFVFGAARGAASLHAQAAPQWVASQPPQCLAPRTRSPSPALRRPATPRTRSPSPTAANLAADPELMRRAMPWIVLDNPELDN